MKIIGDVIHFRSTYLGFCYLMIRSFESSMSLLVIPICVRSTYVGECFKMIILMIVEDLAFRHRAAIDAY